LRMGRKESCTAYLVGYQGRSADEVFNTLVGRGVTFVVDVRRRAASRKRDFSKSALERLSGLYGLGYRHIPDLGPPLPVLHEYRRSGDWRAFELAYLSYLRHAEEALTALEQLTLAYPVCLLCFESDSRVCHRSLLARVLLARIAGLIIHDL